MKQYISRETRLTFLTCMPINQMVDLFVPAGGGSYPPLVFFNSTA